MALHSFSADGPDELSISPGDVVLLVGREGDWLKGRVGGKEGIFPSSFVEVKVDLPPQQKQAKTNCELIDLCNLEAYNDMLYLCSSCSLSYGHCYSCIRL